MRQRRLDRLRQARRLGTIAFGGMLVLSAGMPVMAQVDERGQIRGVVQDAGSEVFLGQARVELTEINRQAVTERDGRFRFRDVPPGEYTLRIDYAGYETSEQSVTVGSGDVEQIRVTLQSGALDEIVVYGQRGQLAGSIARERAANGIISSVTADEIGRFPDQNVAEAVKRLPGMSVDRDKGEARFVIIRGADPSLNAQTINGIRVNSPEAGTRAVAFDVIPAELVDAVDVTKTSSPDQPGDAVGGSIDVQTRSAFDRKDRLASLTVEGSYDDFSDETSPKVSAAYSDSFAIGGDEENFGVSFSMSWFDRDFGDDNSENGSGWSLIDDPQGGGEFRFAEEIEQRSDLINRERIGGALNFDFRVSDNTDLYLRTLYSSFRDREISSRNAIEFNDDLAVSISDRQGTFEGYAFVKELKDRSETQDIFSTTFGGETLFDLWTVGYQLGYSHSEEDEGPRFNAEFVFEDEEIDGRTISYDQSSDKFYRVTSDIANDEFEFDEASTEDNLSEDEEWSLRVDFEREFNFGNHPGMVRFGALSRFREKSQDLSEPIFDGAPDDVTFAGFARPVPYKLGAFGDGWDTDAWQAFFEGNQDLLDFNPEETVIKSTGEDFDADEDVHAAYLMAASDINRLRVSGGVRVEYTDFEADGARIVVDAAGDEFVESVTTDNSYTDILPSLTLRFDQTERISWRAHVGRTIKRPNIETIVPIEEADFEAGEAVISNPDLNTLESTNVDLMVSWYPTNLSVLSVGLFYKDIDNFVVAANVAGLAGTPSAFDGFDEVIQPINGEAAELLGIELNYQQAFENGFLFGANATFVDSEAELALADRKIPLPNQSDATANVIIGYEKHGWNLRLTAAWRDEFLAGLEDPEDPAFDAIRDEHFQVDASVSYTFANNWEVKFEAANLNGENRKEFFGEKRFNSEFERYEPFYNLGVTAQF